MSGVRQGFSTRHRSTALALAVCVSVLAGPVAVLAGQEPAPSAAPGAPAHRVAFDAWVDAQAYAALAARGEAVAALRSASDIRARQDTVRAALSDMLGPLPDRQAPLNARITHTTKRDGYRIEHLIYESQPGYLVTALVYVPDGRGPFPAVLGTAGHSETGKAHPLYQHAWISFARRGFVVLAYDPPGQGERLEYLDPTGAASAVGVGVPEHILSGQQLLLTGSHLAAFMLQDGRRAFDYLETRSDVDTSRVAVAGNSGGGTQAAYLGALEPRLAAAVVSCYLTSWQQMWKTPGPQDAEQVLPGLLARGLDFADFGVAAAPRGFLVSSAVRDYFPIAGARAAYDELRPIFTTLGAPDHVAMVENDEPHGWSQPLREGAYRWLREWLAAPDAPAQEQALEPEDPAALRVTRTGQLATSDGSRTTRAINADRARELAASRPRATVESIRTLMQLPDGPLPPPTTGPVTRDADGSERFLIEVEPGVQLPARLTRPSTAGDGGPVLVLDDRGALASENVAALVAGGHTVLAVDIRGTGDLAPTSATGGYASSYQFAARAWLLGTSVVAWQARDVVAALAILRARVPDAPTVTVHARGLTAAAALVAAQIVKLDTLVLEDSLVSYHDLVSADRYDDVALLVVPGVLTVTDLPELMAMAAPARVVLRHPVSPIGRPIGRAQLTGHLGVAVPANVEWQP